PNLPWVSALGVLQAAFAQGALQTGCFPCSVGTDTVTLGSCHLVTTTVEPYSCRADQPFGRRIVVGVGRTEPAAFHLVLLLVPIGGPADNSTLVEQAREPRRRWLW